jgi:hypothetical protein
MPIEVKLVNESEFVLRIYLKTLKQNVMYLLQFQDAVTVSTLPHPISMFLLGIGTISIIFLFYEYNRTRRLVDTFSKDLNELKNLLQSSDQRTDDKLKEISKKVDSRVDKAILAIKKQDKN